MQLILFIIAIIVVAIAVIYFFAQKKEKAYFKQRFDKIALLLFDIGQKIDKFEEYQDRFLYIHGQLEDIKESKPKDGIERLDALEENIKHLKLDITAKQSLVK